MKWGAANSRRAIAPADRTRQIEAAIFLIPFITYAYFYQGSDQSIACRFDLMRSMVEKGVLWINDFCGYNTADIVTLHGHIYSVKAPGTSYTALIPWMVFRIALLPLSSTHESIYWAFVTYLTTVFTTGLLIAAMCVVMFRFARLCRGVGGPRDRRRADSWPCDARVSLRHRTHRRTSRRGMRLHCVLLAGDLRRAPVVEARAGGRISCRMGRAQRLPGLPGRRRNRNLRYLQTARLDASVRRFRAGAAITVAVMLAYNWGAFGSPFFFSYQAFKLSPDENHQFPEQAVGFVGLTYPKMRILWNVLVDPQRGLFFCNPVLLLSIVGVGYFARLRRWRAEFIVTSTRSSC